MSGRIYSCFCLVPLGICFSHCRKNWPRNIIWYNPPYSKNVETNIGKCFLSLIDLHFPKSNPLYKMFNRNTIKLSYSCMPNIKTIISDHNKSLLSKSKQSDENKNCNCRNPNACPMDGNCNDQNIIYLAEITTPTTKETYIGLCDTPFKLRYRNHVCPFKNERYKHATELSKYIWNLKVKQSKASEIVLKCHQEMQLVFVGKVFYNL